MRGNTSCGWTLRVGMTTFYAIKNKMRCTHLNYRSISALDIFDQAMDNTFEGLDGVVQE